MNTETDDTEVRYCVTAYLDLLGFETHLEIASNDLRTNIGHQAISRLQVLEEALHLIAEERKDCSEYPETYHHIRINDAVIFTLDLPDLLRPSVGESAKTGFSGEEILKLIDVEKFVNADEFAAAFTERLSREVTPLIQFVGMVARVHSFINRRETSEYFPGARTIIASGYRRPFRMQRAEDFLSANFSFSNAHLAEKHLHGPNLFIDNHVSRMLCVNRSAQNLVRFACYSKRPSRFDPFDEPDKDFYLRAETVLTELVDVVLFKKSFQFRGLDPFPLSFLQIVPRLSDYLEGRKEPAQGGDILGRMAQNVLRTIIAGPQAAEPDCFPAFDWVRLDCGNDIRVLAEMIESGESPTLKCKMDRLRNRMSL